MFGGKPDNIVIVERKIPAFALGILDQEPVAADSVAFFLEKT